MKANLTPDAWLFDVEKAPLFASVTAEDGTKRQVPVGRRIAIVDAVAGDVVGVVNNSYRLFTNQEAIDLCRRFCLEAFPNTKDAEWVFRAGHGPPSRSWVAMDLFHRSCAINLGGGGVSVDFTPFVRVTNSYNASRAVRLDVGFMRGICSNGMIITEEAAKIFASHPPESHRMRRDRPTLERVAGAWLRSFRTAAKQPGFSLREYIDGLKPTASGPRK